MCDKEAQAAEARRYGVAGQLEMAAMMANLVLRKGIRVAGVSSVDVLMVSTAHVRIGLPTPVPALIDDAERLRMLGVVTRYAHTSIR